MTTRKRQRLERVLALLRFLRRAVRLVRSIGVASCLAFVAVMIAFRLAEWLWHTILQHQWF